MWHTGLSGSRCTWLLGLILVTFGFAGIATAALDPKAPATQKLQVDPRYDVIWRATPDLDVPAAHVAENPANGFRTIFESQGIRVHSRSPHAKEWNLVLRPVENPGRLHIAANTVEFVRGSIIEWYRNDVRGLEQGFRLLEPPEETGAAYSQTGGSRVAITMALSGNLLPRLGADGRTVDFYLTGERFADLRYGALKVADAQGRTLPAHLEVVPATETDDATLSIVIDTRDAVYPVEVDPLLTAGAWTSTETEPTQSADWGDWDQDGDLDLVVGNFGQANRIYENTGSGLSTTAVWSSTETDNTRSVAWGDWDGDGDLDLAVGNEQQPNRVYENTGSGLSTTAVWSSNESEGTWSVAWGDWDGDGDLDLAVGNSGNDWNRIYENDAGTLAWAERFGQFDRTRSVAWGDWDGDGDLDLAVGNAVPLANQVYENSGEPVFSLSLALSFAADDTTRSVAWGDRDQDGDLDLATGNRGQPNRVYDNTGSGLSTTPVWSSDESDNTESAAWGDWDGDGDLDLAVGNAGGGQPNRVYENTESGLSTTAIWSSTETDNTVAVAWGDWDLDGDLDLAVGNGGGASAFFANRVYLNLGIPLADSAAGSSAETDPTQSVAWGDWNGDGNLDLVVGNFGQANRVYESDGESLSLIWSSSETDNTRSVAWGDWDDDGDLDLAVGNEQQPNRVYENTGSGLSTTAVWSSNESEGTWSVAWGDWDDDGDLDLAVGNAGNDWNRIYENDAGTLAWVERFGQLDRTRSVAWGDWDQDGDLDLAVGNAVPLANQVYENTGGSLSLALSFAPDDTTRSVAWGDWDQDGDLDLATGNRGQPNRVYDNTGSGLSTTAVWSSDESDNTEGAAWGDWDGDGDLDLAVGNAGGGQPNRVYENTGSGLTTTAIWSSTETDNTVAVAWGDRDLDGDLDLAVGNGGGASSFRVYDNGWLNAPGGLPETPVRPVAASRARNVDIPTASAFFFSTPQKLVSPVSIPYELFDEQSDQAWSIVPEYSLTGGGQWLPATEGSGGDGTTELPASPTGTAYVFSWDADQDRACSDIATFRITVAWQAPDQVGAPIQRGRLAATTPPFRVRATDLTWYRDSDGDGFGDPLISQISCLQPAGYVLPDPDFDCDDTNAFCTTDCTDADSDGFCVTTDCNEAIDTVYPAAPELNDALDNQCPGDAGYGVIDEISGDSGFKNVLDKNEFSWTAQPNATMYQVARSTHRDFSSDCVTFETTNNFVSDPSEPQSTIVFYYLVRSLAPNVGSWGQDSTGRERYPPCVSETMCVDGLDDDGDGLVDCGDVECCQDANCDGIGVCQFGVETTCNDSSDNDADGFRDCLDDDCDTDPVCT